MDHSVVSVEQLGPVLQGIRRAQRLTQVKAAARVGLLAKTVSGLETAPARHRLESLFKLLSALDLQLVVRPKPSEPPSRRRAEW